MLASIHVDFVFMPSQVGHHVAVLAFSGNGMNYQIRVGIAGRPASPPNRCHASVATR